MRTHPTITPTALPLLLALTLFATACGDDSTDGVNGQSALFTVTDLAPGADCTAGGIQIDSGLDANANGTLDASEITSTTVICTVAGNDGTDGAPGADGFDGSSGTDGTDGADGTDGFASITVTTVLNMYDDDCYFGGIRIDIGLDDGVPGGTADNGELEDDEIDHTEFVCDGAPAAWSESVTPPEGTGDGTIDASGGTGTAGYGGAGGHVGLEMHYGSFGGHIKVFNTGIADASFDVPVVSAYLGDVALEVSSDLTIPSYPAGSGHGSGDAEVHFHDGDYDDDDMPRLYRRVGTDVEVTGIHVGTGATLTLMDNDTDSTVIRVELDNDFHNEGTVTTFIRPGTDFNRPDLRIDCDIFIGGVGSMIDLSGAAGGSGQDGGDGGGLDIDANQHYGAFFNQGAINTYGGDGDNGGAGGDINIETEFHLYNTGNVDSHGGDGNLASTGDGAFGGAIDWGLAGDGHFFNSGSFDTSGGNGNQDASGGGDIDWSLDYYGTLLNSGDMDTSGGNGVAGGAGGHIDWDVGAAEIITSGQLVTRGGNGTTGDGGAGGAIDIYNAYDASGSGYMEEIPPGNIEISGNIDASGGNGANGGAGGYLAIVLDPDQTPVNQEDILYGFTSGDVSGGNGTTHGGVGGFATFWHAESAGGGLVADGPSGRVVNYADWDLSGGDGAGTYGGDGGYVELKTWVENHWVGESEVVINYGDFDATGGDGVEDGGSADYLQVVAGNGFENHGTLDFSGGDASALNADGGYGGDVDIYSETGPVINTGAIISAGGNATANGADGGNASSIEIWGLTINNSANLSANGGAGGTAENSGDHSNGGDGEHIFLFSWEGTVNIGTLDTSGGTGENPGDEAFSYVDGVNVTP